MRFHRILRRKKVRFFAVTGISFLAVGFLAHHLSLKPLLESQWTARALKINHSRGPASEIMGAFERALSYDTFGDGEARERLALIAQNVINRDNFSREERLGLVEFASKELRKEIATPVKDVKYLQHLARVFKNSYALDPQYLKEAEILLQEAIHISPQKQSLYFDLTDIYLYAREYEKALDTAQKAAAIEPSNVNVTLNLILAARAAGQSELVKDVEVNIKIDLQTAYEDTLQRLGLIYRGEKNFISARVVYEALVLRYPQAKYYAVLAAVLAELGEFELAIENARIAALRNPDFRREAEIFIKRLEMRRVK